VTASRLTKPEASVKKFAIFGLMVTLGLLPFAHAQFGFRGERPLPDRSEFPMWESAAGFKSDVFCFARIKYSSSYGGRGSRWNNDYPDSDWNFSYRLQQMTSMQVDPNAKLLELTDPELLDYPFIFINGVGRLEFSTDEAECLRKYLMNGGFMMVDDFWGEEEWDNMKFEMEKVFPNQTPVDLPYEHPIFHLVYDLSQKPQVPDIRTWRAGRTVEDHGTPGDTRPHFNGLS
jgi:hypothetical protein